MLKIITNKSDYQFSPELATDTVSYDLPLTLFGKQWYIMDDYWMKHIHLKITDRCNAQETPKEEEVKEEVIVETKVEPAPKSCCQKPKFLDNFLRRLNDVMDKID